MSFWHNFYDALDLFSFTDDFGRRVLQAAAEQKSNFLSQVFVFFFCFFMEICFEQRADSLGNYQQELPRGDVFHSSIMSVACQSFFP